MLSEGKAFDGSLMAEGKIMKKAETMSKTVFLAQAAYAEDSGSLKKKYPRGNYIPGNTRE
jgi:hypothetical protein